MQRLSRRLKTAELRDRGEGRQLARVEAGLTDRFQ